MKKIIYLFSLLFLGVTSAEQAYDTSRLNPCLKSLYERLHNNEELTGETHSCTFSLKVANEKWLIFHDGSVGLEYDPATRQRSGYHFLKFAEGMDIPDGLKRGDAVNVTFVIESAHPGSSVGAVAYPVLGVKLIQIEREVNHE